MEIFKLIRKLVQRHPDKIQPIIKNIIDVSKNYAASAKAANEREISLLTLNDLVSNYQYDLSDAKVGEIISQLMAIFDERTPSVRGQ